MICEAPVRGRYPCLDCEPCRINRRRVWTGRILLEAMQHSMNSFVTLTYSPMNIPSGGSLVPAHMSSFLKRLRDRVKPLKLKFYGCGEYGDLSQRPHYHLLLFGLNPFADGFVRDSWKLGFVQVGSLTPDSAQYVAGYVVKKMLKKGDPDLNGRHPEFQRSSTRGGGIGKSAVAYIAETLKDYPLEELPVVLNHGKRKLPLGRYLKEKLRNAMADKDGVLPSKEKPETPYGMLRLSGGERAVKQLKFASSFQRSLEADKKIASSRVRKERNQRSRRSL